MHQTPVLKPFLYFFLERMFLWNRAPSRQITTHKQPISAPCDLTSADQIVSQMNQLAAPLLGGFRAVEIQASREYVGHTGFQRHSVLLVWSNFVGCRAGAGTHESFTVKKNAAVAQPLGRWIHSDKRNTLRIGFSVSAPVLLFRQRTRSSCPPGDPQSAAIWVLVR